MQLDTFCHTRKWMLFSVRADGKVNQSDAILGPTWSNKK